MIITEHFSLEEFNCSDGTSYPLNRIESTLRPLCESLELIRAEAGHPLYIVSGYRTKSYNRKVGGAFRSRHMEGDAADLYCHHVTPLELYDIINEMMEDSVVSMGGLGFYSWGIHYDQRGYKARWKK